MDDLNKEIRGWREQIDKIDLRLVKLLSERAKCADEIGKLKLRLGVEAHSPEREKEVMHNVSAANPGPLSMKAICRIFKRIIDESRGIERATMSEKKKMLRSSGIRRKLFIGLFVITAVILACAYYILLLPNYHHDPKGKLVTVSRGATFRMVADSLGSTGAIRNTWSFELAGRILGYTKSIKVGKYLFVSGQSNFDILRDIRYGKSRLIIPVTIPEGWPLEKIVHRFEHDLGIDENLFLSLCQNEKFIHDQGINAQSLEGYLLPDTYSFYWQTDEQEILTRILEEFKHFYNDSLTKKQDELGKTQSEILTLASIVEAESNVDEERPRVAGVYWNRMKKHMRLEADPTVQYALGEGRRLRFLDLDINSPYNTYRRLGLPPGPINNPGKLSILAALYPEQNDFLFFVATGIGGHRFAKNYSDHQKNIRLYHHTKRELKQLSSN